MHGKVRALLEVDTSRSRAKFARNELAPFDSVILCAGCRL